MILPIQEKEEEEEEDDFAHIYSILKKIKKLKFFKSKLIPAKTKTLLINVRHGGIRRIFIGRIKR
jgi:hypothetical protein